MITNRLLDVAISVFGHHGLQGASTRQIAREADSAMSAITYHYGGKEGLYLAAADRIAEQLREGMERHLSAAAAVEDDDRDGARDALQDIFRSLSQKMTAEDTADHTRFILREQMNPTAAFDHIYDGFMQGMFACMMRLVCIATGVDERVAAIVVSALSGQAMSPRSSRALLLRKLGLGSYDEATRLEIQHVLVDQVDAMLNNLANKARPLPKEMQ